MAVNKIYKTYDLVGNITVIIDDYSILLFAINTILQKSFGNFKYNKYIPRDITNRSFYDDIAIIDKDKIFNEIESCMKEIDENYIFVINNKSLRNINPELFEETIITEDGYENIDDLSNRINILLKYSEVIKSIYDYYITDDSDLKVFIDNPCSFKEVTEEDIVNTNDSFAYIFTEAKSVLSDILEIVNRLRIRYNK